MSRIASDYELERIKEIRYTFSKSKSHKKWLRKCLINKLPKEWKNIYYPKNN